MQSSTFDDIAASVYTWLLLAGFIVFPSTFLNLQTGTTGTLEGITIERVIKHIPLLCIAGSCTLAGTVMICQLWVKRRTNYEWLINHLFLPALCNSFIGLVTALFNIYTARSGLWSVTAIVTVVATGTCNAFMGIMYVLYSQKLSQVKMEHNNYMGI
ncbi:hypothetical protein N431DRAFT_338074 [Stipitochalara longipes BDJ]|nr:hypothetical protein N431DRAFT_338074 [Stipitochalara longipes BDJ]